MTVMLACRPGGDWGSTDATQLSGVNAAVHPADLSTHPLGRAARDRWLRANARERGRHADRPSTRLSGHRRTRGIPDINAWTVCATLGIFR